MSVEKILSIIVPSYNMEKYLPKCLGSLVVAPELMERLEVLVVNDGSKDRTSEIAHEFAAKWPQTFKVIDKPNGHYGSCINAALPASTGRYVKVLDADDAFDTSVLADYIAFLEKSGVVDVVYSSYSVVDASGRVVRAVRTAANPKGVKHLEIAYRTQLLREMDYRQTEGILYADLQWAAVPFVAVKSAATFDGSLYVYLLGRQGQSSELEIWERNIGMLAKVALDILQWADARRGGSYDLTHPSDVAYDLLRTVYSTCLASGHRRWVAFDLHPLDADLARRYPEVHERLGRELYTSKCRIRFVRAWRRGLVRDRLALALPSLHRQHTILPRDLI